MPYWLSVVFAFFAVPGLYYVFCVLFGSLLVKKPYAVMICGDRLSASEIMIEVRSAQIYLEGRRGFLASPIVGFRQLPDAATLACLRENGIAYTKIFEND